MTFSGEKERPAAQHQELPGGKVPLARPRDAASLSLRMNTWDMLSFLFDLLFPCHSLTGTEGLWITDDERKAMKLTPILLHTSALRKKGWKHVDCLVAAGAYDDEPLLKKAILTMKYHRVPALADDLGDRMAAAVHGLLIFPEDVKFARPVLCPVPLHWSRRFHRGFNQAELLARRISGAKEWDMNDILRRRRPTGHQALRTRDERLTAVTGAFACSVTPPPVVILIDDIVATGATLEACAKALKEAGTRFVAAIVAAYG